MKTLTLQEAAQRGLKTFRYGMHSYVAAALPRGFDYHRDSALEVLLNQWECAFEDPAATEETGGYCVQAVEDIYGAIALPGTIYIVRAFYDEANGVQDWTFYAALKVS